MTPEKVSTIITKELQDNPGNPNLIQSGLMKPCLEIYTHAIDRNLQSEFWTVYHDGTKEGYRVVYSEQEDIFGLATAGDQRLFLSFYGSFLDTINNM